MDDEAIHAQMRRVAALPDGSPLSVAFYDRHRGDGALTAARIIQRLGSWSAACDAAGVATNKPSRKTYTHTWSEEDLIGWVRRYLAESDKSSYADFTRWLKEQKDAPSANTVRNAFGGWSAVLDAAR